MIPMYETSAFNNVQNTLSRAQAMPLVGMLVSPIKALVSVAQIVSGIAASFFLTCIGVATVNPFVLCLAASFLKEDVGGGLKHLFYAAVNMATFTLAGFCIEAPKALRLNF